LALLEDLKATVAGLFGRREPRNTFWDLVTGLLMELPTATCWTVGEAVGHAGPHRLQHLLYRAVWDGEAVLAAVARWAAGYLSGPAVLAVDETGDAKSSNDAAGAAQQYSGALGGVGLCQVAVHLSLATPAGHAVIGRRLYPGADWAGDDERRTLAGVPDDLAFATKPDLAITLLRQAVAAGVRAVRHRRRGLRLARVPHRPPHPGPGLRGRDPDRPPGHHPRPPPPHLHRRHRPGPDHRLDPDAHRQRHQGRQGLRLGRPAPPHAATVPAQKIIDEGVLHAHHELHLPCLSDDSR
jgi:DDE superfamily endonuclease